MQDAEQAYFNVIEAILFVSGEPVAMPELAAALDLTEIETIPVIERMRRHYAEQERGIQLLMLGNKLQLCTNEKYAASIKKMFHTDKERSLSQAALETLSIIAYKQPVTRAEIEALRGVKCDHSIAVLTEHGLIEEVGRKDTIGRPRLFGTTDAFLRHFGLSSLSELPPRPDPAPETVPETSDLSEEE